jgi:hypothetical protein
MSMVINQRILSRYGDAEVRAWARTAGAEVAA